MTLSRTLLVAALGLSLAACDSSTGPESESDAAPVLSNVATDVITATYADLAAEAADLVTAVGAFADDRSAGRLEAARRASSSDPSTRRAWTRRSTAGPSTGPTSTPCWPRRRT